MDRQSTLGDAQLDALRTMRAVWRPSYGSVQSLELREVPLPTLPDDHVLVRVGAAGIDPGMWHLVTGEPRIVRLMGYGVRAPKAPALGRDVAGEVIAVGTAVTKVSQGDQVFGACSGALAEYAVIREDQLAVRPRNVSIEQAGAVAVSGVTALQALRDRGDVREGQRVLIIGAGGGVGTLAVQLARNAGAHVTGVCSTGKVDLVLELGAHEVIDYTRQDPVDGSTRYDLIVDAAGNRPLRRLRRAMTADGALVIVGGETGGRWLGGVQRVVRAVALSPFVRQQLRPLMASITERDLEELANLLADERLTVVVDRTYALDEAAGAIAHVQRGHTTGKVVVVV